MTKPSNLYEEMRNSPGYEINQWLGVLRGIHYIFNRNNAELVAAITTLSSDEAHKEVWAPQSGSNQQLALIEISRLLNNYVASALMVVDITRKHVNKWYSSDKKFLNENQKKVDELIENTIIVFFQDLRAFILHYFVPPIAAEISAKQNNESGEVTVERKYVFDKSELQKSTYKWKSKSKRFLHKADSKIDILKLVNEYHRLRRQNHIWLYKIIEEKHKSELEDFFKKRDAYNNIFYGLFK